MSCYHPMIAVPNGLTENGKIKYAILKDPNSNAFTKEFSEATGAIKIPCGKCIGCRLDYSRSWADRMMLELDTCEEAIFLTLTYDNDHMTWSKFDNDGVPLFGTVNVRDCQLFMKRLRKHFEGRLLRFYLASEYGPSTLRPHYHAIIFGIRKEDFFDLRPCGKNELGQMYFTSATMEKIWDNGFVLFSDVNWKTCAYVSRYITKKLNGEYQKDRYDLTGQLKEFSLMSRKPGIGKPYLDLHPDALDFQNINLSTPDGGLQIQIPKYFLKMLNNENNPLYDPERYVIMMQQRKKYAEDSMLLKLQKTGLGYLDYLEMTEEKKRKAIKSLVRTKA